MEEKLLNHLFNLSVKVIESAVFVIASQPWYRKTYKCLNTQELTDDTHTPLVKHTQHEYKHAVYRLM